jgi:hypothetical protein
MNAAKRRELTVANGSAHNVLDVPSKLLQKNKSQVSPQGERHAFNFTVWLGQV